MATFDQRGQQVSGEQHNVTGDAFLEHPFQQELEAISQLCRVQHLNTVLDKVKDSNMQSMDSMREMAVTLRNFLVDATWMTEELHTDLEYHIKKMELALKKSDPYSAAISGHYVHCTSILLQAAENLRANLEK